MVLNWSESKNHWLKANMDFTQFRAFSCQSEFIETSRYMQDYCYFITVQAYQHTMREWLFLALWEKVGDKHFEHIHLCFSFQFLHCIEFSQSLGDTWNACMLQIVRKRNHFRIQGPYVAFDPVQRVLHLTRTKVRKNEIELN